LKAAALFNWTRRSLGIAALTILCWHPRSSGADQPRFELSAKPAFFEDYGFFTNYVVETDAIQCEFKPPVGARVEADSNARTVKVSPGDSQCHMLLIFTSNNPVRLTEPYRADLQREVEARYAGAKIESQPSFPTAVGQGALFDIEQKTAFHTSLTTRLVFMPIPSGTLEVAMTTTSTNFTAHRFVFAGFLGSIRVRPVATSPPSPAQSHASAAH
jgi:hypothetical protein